MLSTRVIPARRIERASGVESIRVTPQITGGRAKERDGDNEADGNESNDQRVFDETGTGFIMEQMFGEDSHLAPRE